MGSLFANKPRIGDGGGGGGGGTSGVQSVNSKTPNASGNVTITYSDVGAAPTIHNHTIEEVTGLRDELNLLATNNATIASNTTLGHVKVDDVTVKITTDGTIYTVTTGTVKSVNGTVADTNGNVQLDIPEVYDGLDSQDTTKALSANKGYELKVEIDDHKDTHASATTYGHVKIDEDTIKVNADGQLYADVSSGEGTVKSVNNIQPDVDGNVTVPIPEIYDALDSTSTEQGLSANQGKVLDDKITEVTNELLEHEEILASTTVAGHVKIDDITIKIDADGKIYSTNTSVPLNVIEEIDVDTDYTLQDVTGAEASKDLIIEVNEHKAKVASDLEEGHVKIDNSTIKINADGQIYADVPMAEGTVKSVNGELPDVDGNVELAIPTVYDALDSTSITEALSANQGLVLDGKIIQVDSRVTTHEETIASDTQEGHVKIDNDTIKVNADGQIYAEVGTNLNVVETIDVATEYTPTDVLGAEAGKDLLIDLNEHKEAIASTTELGHVKVDGDTIIVDPDGTIKAAQSVNLSGIHNTEIVLTPGTVGQLEFEFAYNDYQPLKHPNMLFLNTVKQLPDSYTLTKVDDSTVKLVMNEVPQTDTFVINITIFDGTLPNGQVGFVSKLEYTLTTNTVGQTEYDFVAPEYEPDKFAVLVFTNSVKMLPTEYTLTNVSGDTWRITVTEPAPSLSRIFSVVMLNGQGASTDQSSSGGGGGGESQFIHYGTNPPTDEKAIWIVD